ncbi:MAG: hypothetical protein LBF22_12385 [Deltaproteobacteria bacterium]|jgi:hypothetical protein|nr:hypothetical protein [Deltaproteobacteria bacterium]
MKSYPVKKQKEVLLALERHAKNLGIKVNTGKLIFSGIRLRAGQCLFREQVWLILDRFQPFEEKVDLFREAFVFLNLKPQDFPNEIREVLFPGRLIGINQVP